MEPIPSQPERRPIVHIGYHKTATTWFQKRFYPLVQSHSFIPRKRVKSALLGPTALAFDPAEARKQLALPDEDPAILCEEELSGYLHNGGMWGYLSKEMAHRLHATLPNARIVIFIRSQPEMIAACYQQYVRGGGTHSLRRYLFADSYRHGASAEPYKIGRFSFDHLEYDRLIAHYDEIFGAANVHVYAYEELRAERAAFLKKFARDLGLQIDLARLAIAPVNKSYSSGLLVLARLLNLFTYRTVSDKRYLVHIPYWYSARRYLLETLNRLVPRPASAECLLGASLLTWVQRRYGESNARLARNRDLGLERLGYPVAVAGARDARPPLAPWAGWARY